MESSMKKLEISAAFAPKVPKGTRGGPVSIKTNVNELKLKPNIPIFKYDIRMLTVYKKSDGTEARKELTKQTKDDYPEQERKGLTVSIYTKLLNDPKYKSYFGDKHSVFYDRAASLLTLTKLPLKSAEGDVINLPNDYVCGLGDAVGVEVTIKECAESFQATTNDLKKCVDIRQSNEDKTLLEALNLIISQPALLDKQKFVSYGNGVHYLYSPDPNVFRDSDFPHLPDGKYMGVGAHESVKVLEGTGGVPTAFVTTETKKTAFHGDGQPLLEKLQQMSLFGNRFSVDEANRNAKKIKDQLKNLYVETTYGKRKQMFPILGLGQSASQLKINVDGKTVSLDQYFSQKYGIKLRYPQLFTIISRSPGRKEDNFYPVELLSVCPSQRVISSQQTPDQNSITIKACANLPKDRLRQTEAMKKCLSLDNSNPYLKKAGITIDEKGTIVNGRVLPAPMLQYASKQIVRPTDNCKWTGQNLLKPSVLSKWMMVGMFLQRDRSFPIEDYAKRLFTKMNQMSMKASPPKIEKCERPSEQAVDEYLRIAKTEGYQLVFFVSADSLKLHDYIKLQEATLQVLTQEVRISKALAVIQKNQVQTLENVILKTNAKLGGLSKVVLLGSDPKTADWILDKNRLFIGFEFSHPDPMSKAELDRGGDYRMPTVVGWGANCSKEVQMFIGDFHYVEPRQSKPLSDSLGKTFELILRKFHKNRGFPPSHLVVYFNGISQGQWNMVAGEYVNIVKATCRGISAAYSPNLTFVAVTKEHNERFYNSEITGNRAAEQNIRPGTVLDSVIVSSVVTEFYLNAHSAFQGTTKTPKYSVLVDTTKMPCDVIEGMTHGLCYMHEIVNMTVSLPAPLMVADRCAKRGKNNFAAMSGSDATSSGSGKHNLEQANRELTYNGKPLSDVHYNA